jgi:hypothetical protein
MVQTEIEEVNARRSLTAVEAQVQMSAAQGSEKERDERH